MGGVIKAVRNAAYCAPDAIECEVWFSDVVSPDGSPKYLPYTATAQDSTECGRALYSGLVAGEYGEITPYSVTPEGLAAAREAKYEEINRWRNQQENGRYVFRYAGRHWDYGKDTQVRLGVSVMMAKQNKLPPQFVWTDADNQDVSMNASELIALSEAINQAMFAKGLAIHLRQRAMKQAVATLGTLAEIDEYPVDWSTEEVD